MLTKTLKGHKSGRYNVENLSTSAMHSGPWSSFYMRQSALQTV